MADLYPGLALGDAVDEEQAVIEPFKCESAVTKGQVVIFNTHTAGELPSVSTAGALATNVMGVAMKTGAIGETIPVLRTGLVKVKAVGAIVGGVLIVIGAAGTVSTIGANTFEKVVGMAIQTFADGDEGIVDLRP
jgi:hypothetical protein